ncbi:hypothetical protein roselon_01816 [Roseibacterium elongatum DSM 19469]|uniref:DUF2946 domain-containing protein n=1 Tax=Roseicyclus elongatus DSM 19469 TaxID=1294273 RepID=W8S1X2_9RHOB|nr:hypothetical protein [Roseibacterium elongatum]AHM04182.1 hypothetical protein roselon_01816 [Roseibacterium elongatum DSM 19469]
MRTTHFILGFALAMLMSITGLATAMARGAMAADGVLCGYGGAQIVLAVDGLPLFDDRGDPVELTEHPCPDCVIGALALAPGTLVAPPVTGPASALSDTTFSALAPTLWRLGGQGRSPPRAA